MKDYALFVAPWDLADRGTDELLGWSADQGINTIILASVYHAGWFLHPHARTRKAYLVDDGAGYFHPNAAEYDATPIRPIVAAMARDRDWVGEAANACRRRGLKLVLWTVCLHNTRLGLQHPDATCRNAYGDSYPHALCPSHAHVRDYVAALVRDQAQRYRPDGFLLEATGYHRGRTHGSPAGGIAGHHHERDGQFMPALEQFLLNLSFSPSDCAAAAEAGIDVDPLRVCIRSHLDAFFQSEPPRSPGSADTLEAFRRQCPDLLRYEALQDQLVDRLLAGVRNQPAMHGIHLWGDTPRIAFDGVLAGCYNQTEQRVEANLRRARQTMTSGQTLIAGLRLGFNPPPDTPAINSLPQAERIARAAARLSDGLAFYFYGEAPAPTLAWVRPMTHAAESPLRPTGPGAGERPLRVGLIGAGAIGAVHATALCASPDVRLACVVDIHPDKAQRLATALAAPRASADADAVLDDPSVDLVVVATPPRFHAALAERALAAGKHLLLEKPMGRTLEECDRIVDVAERSRGRVGVALVHRYEGSRFAARELIRSGAIGRVQLIRYRWGIDLYADPRFDGTGRDERSWIVNPEFAGGGLLPSSAIHTVSVISFVLDEPRFLEVSGRVRRLHPRAFDGIEDDVSLHFRLDGGIDVVFEETWTADVPYEMRITGDRGWLLLRGPLHSEVNLTGECHGPRPAALRRRFEAQRIACRPHELDELALPYFAGLATDMTRACRGDEAPDLPGLLHARNMRAVITAAVDASRLEEPVRVPWHDVGIGIR